MNISILIDDFLKQNIQSEAEVRSKLIVPLLELLEYPKDFRAEEFPVYGYEGSKALKTKAADFLQFTSNEFDEHRGKSDSEVEWVYKHSLLVFEAKKPKEKILVKGQPVFYSAWTKSVAYMISNGTDIEGYVVNANYSDTCVFSCKVKEIPEKWEELNLLNYNRVLELKKSADVKGKWTNRDIYENYKNAMRVRCTEELCTCVDRSLKEFTYDLNIIKNGESKGYDDILDNTCKIITSEPGGGKSYLMWMLMRDYLSKYNEDEEKIPVILEGRYYGKVFHSIVDGIYEEFKMVLPYVTKELIEKRLREGGFIILFDALDEVEHDYDVLVYNLHQLRRNTDNIIIVTSRMQNYKGDFCTEFVHYSLEPLDDDRVTELLKQYSHGEMQVQIHQIPKQLIEVIRTPLFLKMFVSISKKDNQYKIPSNHAALFQEYITEKMKALSCSLYDENVMKSVLGEYAMYSYENGDSTEQFFEILDNACVGLNKTNMYEKIWKTGLMADGLQGIKFCHKALEEFFIAVELSTWSKVQLISWLDSNVLKERYNEVICYLTGIISNQQKQNYVLDYLETHHLQLFIKALESRRNFDIIEIDLDSEYAQSYYAQILKTYDTIVQTYFYKIRHVFDGYNIQGAGKVCIRGDMSFAQKSISMIIYNGTPEAKNLDVTVSAENGMHMVTADGATIPINSSVFSIGVLHERYYNLELLSYGFDSSREIAVDIIKNQIKVALDQKSVFDIDIDVLLVERTEKELKKLRNEREIRKDIRDLSLYVDDISSVISKVTESGIFNQDVDRIITFCKVLKLRMNNAENFLDVKADLTLEPGRHSYWFDELYSDEQLVRKIERILTLSNEAVQTITTDIIPVLSTVRPVTRLIGVVHRKGKFSGVSYIRVEVRKDEDTAPIIEFREDDIQTYPNLDSYYVDKLKQIGKSENSVLGSNSSVLHLYFGDDVFHDLIYGEIKEAFVSLLGKL
ncbi:NACHT domain-containing protein [Bariatricus sp. HCP28S3_A7]|uniref:NACHT domain-containing protein n=1 Tax=Bariatricus sp. HCP28S3_A7 TaxID=3438894 RepID=UPI003F8AC381